MRGIDDPRPNGVLIFNCKTCGKEHTTMRFRPRKFCSVACSMTAPQPPSKDPCACTHGRGSHGKRIYSCAYCECTSFKGPAS
jgi:hypothetical protein